MGLPGKPDGMTGAEVEKYYRDGHIREIADYCESDVVNTYRVWLRYELISRTIVGARVSRQRGKSSRVRDGAGQYEAASNWSLVKTV
jgi:predicted PolB exonuclease-like 3'-5' exonuclease